MVLTKDVTATPMTAYPMKLLSGQERMNCREPPA